MQSELVMEELVERGDDFRNRLKHVIKLKAAYSSFPPVTMEQQDIPLENVQGHVKLRLVGGGRAHQLALGVG